MKTLTPQKTATSIAEGCLVANRAADGDLRAPFRLPEDGWWMALATGEHPGTLDTGDRIIQVVDDKARAAIIESFNRDVEAWKAKGTSYPGMLVDYDHFSHDTDKSSEAAAWIFELQDRPEGIFARGKWTATGETKVTAGDYRFSSAVLSGFTCVGGTRCRPSKIERVALTNDPNVKGQEPITVPNRNQTQTMNHKSILAALLGLSEASEDAAIQSSVDKFKADHGSIPSLSGKLATVQNRVTEIEAEASTSKNRVKALIEELADKDIAEYKDFVEDAAALKTALVANREGTIAILKSLKRAAPAQAQEKTDAQKAVDAAAAARAARKPVFNRDQQGGRNPGPVGKDEGDRAAFIARKITVRANEIVKNRRCSMADAFLIAKRDVEAQETATE